MATYEEEITLTEARAHLADAQDALTAARAAAQYSVGDKQVIRANLESLRREIGYWSRKVRELNGQANDIETSGVLTPKWD